MSYSITFSTKILTLEIAPILFISVEVSCEFALVLDVYIVLSPLGEEVPSSACGDRYTYVTAHSSKRFKLLPVMLLICLSNMYKKHDRTIIAMSLVLLV